MKEWYEVVDSYDKTEHEVSRTQDISPAIRRHRFRPGTHTTLGIRMHDRREYVCQDGDSQLLNKVPTAHS
jgi:hypothetical protein